MDERPPTLATEEAFYRSLLAEHQRQAETNQLTAAEIIAVREILENDRVWKRVTSGLKTWAIWLAAVFGAATIGFEALRSAVKALGR